MNEKILIAYFSRSGNTKRIAKCIQESVGGELHEIQPATVYPAAYNAVVEQAKTEIRAGFKPALKSNIGQMADYETVFIGSPNWWSTIAPPVATFLTQHDMAGKTIVPFCTHGGGGLARLEVDIVNLCPNARVLDGFEAYEDVGNDIQSQVIAWLQRIGMAA